MHTVSKGTHPLLNMSAMEGCLEPLDDRRVAGLAALPPPPFFTEHLSTSSLPTSLLHVHVEASMIASWPGAIRGKETAELVAYVSAVSSISTQPPPNILLAGVCGTVVVKTTALPSSQLYSRVYCLTDGVHNATILLVGVSRVFFPRNNLIGRLQNSR